MLDEGVGLGAELLKGTVADELDLMIDRVRARRTPSTPLSVTCTEVFYEFADEMSDETFLALEETGRAVGQPALDGKAVPEALAGFLALAAEALLAEEESP
jgi:hypothetical protein